MRKTDKGIFTPKNPQKYMGDPTRIQYRSSWELTTFMFLDNHPSCIGWLSEGLSIPYRNPLTGRWTMYVPDILAVYVDKNGKQHCDLIEIKPLKETPGYKAKRLDEHTKLTQAINAAKWQAATQYAAKRGWTFRVLTEEDLFKFKRK